MAASGYVVLLMLLIVSVITNNYVCALGRIRTPDRLARTEQLCPLSYEGMEDGAAYGSRTRDLALTKGAL